MTTGINFFSKFTAPYLKNNCIMIYVLLAWLLPFIIILITLYIVEDETATVRDALHLIGMGLVPFFNWFLIYQIVVDFIENNDKIQEFLNRKLK